MIQNTMKILIIFSLTTVLFAGSAFADSYDSERTRLLVEATEPFLKGEYKTAIKIFDEILEIHPNDSEIFEMKGIALSNLRLGSTLAAQPQQNSSPHDASTMNKLSMLEFYKALEIDPYSVLALNGMGLGFGNFGEYSESERYFKKSLELDPDNAVTQNYLTSIKKIKEKYSLDKFESPTIKPDFLQKIEENTIPYWIKNNAKWWSDDKISDNDFLSGIEYLLSNNIIKINSQNSKGTSSDLIPSWIKNNAKWWSGNKISDDDFLSGIKYLVENNIIKLNSQRNSELVVEELERKAWNFEQYIRDIQIDIKKQNRYVENINPSEYVIIKYWKDYSKWNLEQFLDRPDIFPDRKISLDPETDRYVIEYMVYINDQPPGLPIDHTATLVNSFDFWEKREFIASDGKKATAKFSVTDKKAEANVWVTWVVRNMGEGVLGHANLGKGVVEVAIGSYACDGSFQLFGADTVEYVMTHELGHSLGFAHSSNSKSIMYSYVPHVDYAYCLLG